MLLFNRSFPFLKNRIRCGDLTTLQNSQFKINATQNWNSMRQNISIHTQKTTEYSMTWWSHRKRLEFARLFFVIFDGVLLLFSLPLLFRIFSTFFLVFIPTFTQNASNALKWQLFNENKVIIGTSSSCGNEIYQILQFKRFKWSLKAYEHTLALESILRTKKQKKIGRCARQHSLFIFIFRWYD